MDSNDTIKLLRYFNYPGVEPYLAHNFMFQLTVDGQMWTTARWTMIKEAGYLAIFYTYDYPTRKILIKTSRSTYYHNS